MGCGEFLVKYILFFANLVFAVSEMYFYNIYNMSSEGQIRDTNEVGTSE